MKLVSWFFLSATFSSFVAAQSALIVKEGTTVKVSERKAQRHVPLDWPQPVRIVAAVNATYAETPQSGAPLAA